MGLIVLIVLAAVDLFFMIWSMVTKELHVREKGVVRVSELLLTIILLAAGILEWGFRYYAIVAVLFAQAAYAGILLVRNREKQYKRSRTVTRFILTVILYTGALSVALLCPQYTQPVATGDYNVVRAKYTWTDESRAEAYSDTGEKRSLTVEFWYPENAGQKYPLVIFSHGAFGFSGSNSSAFEELASNGYVVASIGHTYQAFFTVDTAQKLTFADAEFVNTAVAVQNGDKVENEYEITHNWLKLRVEDESFVLDTILRQADTEKADALFSMIQTDKIGLFGHSLGGAASAELGRLRDEIDAVIVLDGTMLGEQLGPDGGAAGLNPRPYPIPLLNIYAEDHYSNAMNSEGDIYPNFFAAEHALSAQEVVIKGAGHLNFTDLPLFSPLLGRILGVGDANARYCIETINHIVLEYFDCQLKGMAEPHFEKEY